MNALDLMDKLIADDAKRVARTQEDVAEFIAMLDARHALGLLTAAAELVLAQPNSDFAKEWLAREVAACQRAPTCTHVDLPRWDMAA